MKINVKLSAGVAGFAEDKDYAKQLRHDEILPALAAGKGVTLDFARSNMPLNPSFTL